MKKRYKVIFDELTTDAKFLTDDQVKESKEMVKKYISDNELDDNKINSSNKIIDLLNNEETSIAILGGPGSGKTTTVNTAMNAFYSHTYLKPIKIFFLYLFLMIVTPFSKKYSKKLSKKIAYLRNKQITVNLWTLFGLRSKSDYTEDMKTLGIKEVYTSSFYDQKATHLFTKRTIWKSVMYNLFPLKNWSNTIKKTIQNDFYISNKNISKNVRVLSPLIYMPIIIFALPFAVVIMYIFKLISMEVTIALIGVVGVLEAVYLVVHKEFHSNKFEYKLNEILKDPNFATTISWILEKKLKRKNITFHFTELDRLNKWLSDNSKSDLIESIIETIALIYSTKNINVIVELDYDILYNYNHKFKASNQDQNGMFDITQKIFGNVVDVRAFDVLEWEKIVWLDYEFVLDEKNISLSDDFGLDLDQDRVDELKKYYSDISFNALIETEGRPSWRKTEEYKSIFKNTFFGELGQMINFDKNEIMKSLIFILYKNAFYRTQQNMDAYTEYVEFASGEFIETKDSSKLQFNVIIKTLVELYGYNSTVSNHYYNDINAHIDDAFLSVPFTNYMGSTIQMENIMKIWKRKKEYVELQLIEMSMEKCSTIINDVEVINSEKVFIMMFKDSKKSWLIYPVLKRAENDFVEKHISKISRHLIDDEIRKIIIDRGLVGKEIWKRTGIGFDQSWTLPLMNMDNMTDLNSFLKAKEDIDLISAKEIVDVYLTLGNKPNNWKSYESYKIIKKNESLLKEMEDYIKNLK